MTRSAERKTATITPIAPDNEISWLHWDKADQSLLDFTRKLIHFRHKHPAFCRKGWFRGHPIKGIGVEDIAWFLPDGGEMTEEHWNQHFAKTVAVFLNGRSLHQMGPKGEKIIDDSFYIIFNAHHEPLDFKLPQAHYAKDWRVEIDTVSGFVDGAVHKAEDTIQVDGLSIVVLSHTVVSR
ncbi:hypothetical protein MKQ70_04595 [Chitinophaga sedimenti]|uniref:hypothetical protein n=1 Tax=Chitinophaga sedimenti TaxID=2033606 RepID=UPI002004C261|nr:hypothetical protein [Chitinophaga sedimenti]MCK7554325.1 hypothetical protein [Chitinophaga sedimenti]